MRNLLLTTTLIAFATPAFATTLWKIDPTASHVTFTATQSSESVKGAFSKFTAMIDFDPAEPSKGHIDATVDTTSVTIEGKDRQDALPTADWLDVKQFPTAVFHATSISLNDQAKSAGKSYTAHGNLKLHGVDHPATLTFALTRQGPVTLAEGDLTLNRNDYNIGKGEWADDKWIAFPVTVHISLHATPFTH